MLQNFQLKLPKRYLASTHAELLRKHFDKFVEAMPDLTSHLNTANLSTDEDSDLFNYRDVSQIMNALQQNLDTKLKFQKFCEELKRRGNEYLKTAVEEMEKEAKENIDW